jgi:hypothetical protein
MQNKLTLRVIKRFSRSWPQLHCAICKVFAAGLLSYKFPIKQEKTGAISTPGLLSV